jgi:oligopeptide/dipeptide ABC transporter ATP-binding protein
MEELLRVEDLHTYFYGSDAVVKAVNGVSFSVKKGETFGLVGESGCGKTATCRSISRLINPPGKIVSGHIHYNGTDVLALGDEAMRKLRGSQIGMIFQEPMTSLNPVVPIRTQIFESLPADMPNAQKRARAIELLKLVGIPSPEARLGAYIHEFSGGMRQRAMIAIALASQPRLLLADEPTTALDVTIQNQIMLLLSDLKDRLGMSMILVTHDLGVVSQMCDNVAVMYAGHIVEICDTVRLFLSPRHPYTYGLLCSLPRENQKALVPINGAPPDLATEAKGCPFAPRCQFRGPGCEEALPELKEIEPGHSVRCRYWEKLVGLSGLEPKPIGEVTGRG